MKAGVLITGATGLVGGAVVERLLRDGKSSELFVLVRSRGAAARLLAGCAGADRVTPVIGDVTCEGLGLDRAAQERMSRSVCVIIHSAADTSFSQTLDAARSVNTAGTRHALELGEAWGIDRFVQVSTAYVAGARTGTVLERDLTAEHGFVNAYEQSKYEAELLVRESRLPYVVIRPATIISDDVDGRVTQYNAVHRALRVFHAGFGALMPGSEDTPVDMVPNDRVVEAVARLAYMRDVEGRSFHLCAGAGAMPLGELLDEAHALWSRDTQWRRRGILRPALTDLATYRLFEQSVEETGDVRLATITRSLTHFVPQLATPKVFDTTGADDVLDSSAPPVSTYWHRVIDHLLDTRWGATREVA